MKRPEDHIRRRLVLTNDQGHHLAYFSNAKHKTTPFQRHSLVEVIIRGDSLASRRCPTLWDRGAKDIGYNS